MNFNTQEEINWYVKGLSKEHIDLFLNLLNYFFV